MVTGEQLIQAREKCKDECDNCIASINGKSCKDYQRNLESWQKKMHKQFAEILRSANE